MKNMPWLSFCTQVLETVTSYPSIFFYLETISFSSPELKAQVSFSDRPLSVVCLAVSLSVCLLNIYIFDFFFRTAGPILTRFGKSILGQRGFRIIQMKDNPLPQGEIIVKE
jgi:hypothetical protein